MTIYRVDPANPSGQGAANGSTWGDSCTLAYAASNAGSGDSVYIKEGTLQPSATETFASGVSLYGGFDSALTGTGGTVAGRDLENDVTTIDQQTNRRCIAFASSSSGLMVDGIRFYRGYSGASASGGAFICANAQLGTCRNCVFDANDSAWGGDHVSIEGTGGTCTWTFENCIFINGVTATAVKCRDGGTLNLYNCTWYNNNYSASDATDMEIGHSTSTVTVTNCLMYDGNGSNRIVTVLGPRRGSAAWTWGVVVLLSAGVVALLVPSLELVAR